MHSLSVSVHMHGDKKIKFEGLTGSNERAMITIGGYPIDLSLFGDMPALQALRFAVECAMRELATAQEMETVDAHAASEGPQLD